MIFCFYMREIISGLERCRRRGTSENAGGRSELSVSSGTGQLRGPPGTPERIGGKFTHLLAFLNPCGVLIRSSCRIRDAVPKSGFAAVESRTCSPEIL